MSPDDPFDEDEDVDIDPARRAYLREVYARLDELTYYELLGVAPTASKKELKSAYFARVGAIHPDRYFNKRLGSYKAKMEAVFARVTDAHATLSSPEARQAYDASLAARVPSERPAARVPVAPAVVDRAAAARRADALEALKRRYEEAKGKAKVHAAHAARARAASDFVGAAAAYEQALLITPQDPALRAAYAEVQAAGAERLVSSHVQQAVLEERYGHWAEAAASWERVLAVRPDDAEAKARLAVARSRSARR